MNLATDVGPNISGTAEVDSNANGFAPLIFTSKGAFSIQTSETDSEYASYLSDKSIHSRGVFTLDATRSASAYGRSDTIQPSSLRLLVCIRT